MKTPAGYRISRFGVADAPGVAVHLDQILPLDWRDGPTADAKQMSRALAHPGMILIGATTLPGVPAGYVSGTVAPKLNGLGDTAFLEDLFVASTHRGHELGRALVLAFRSAVVAVAQKPLSMWAATAIDNSACDGAFRAAGGMPEGEIFREYNWPVVKGIST